MSTEHFCFCELAPLYVLDLLNETERVWVEAEIAACPDRAQELADYQAAATAIPYAAPEVPLSLELKAKLFDRLNLDLPVPSSPVPEPPVPQPVFSEFLAVRSQDLEWQPHAAPGIFIALLRTDLALRQAVGILRAEPGAQYPRHRHAGLEEIYMLSGDLIIGDQVYGGGDYICSSPGTVHAPYTETGCMFFFRASLDDQYDLALI